MNSNATDTHTAPARRPLADTIAIMADAEGDSDFLAALDALDGDVLAVVADVVGRVHRAGYDKGHREGIEDARPVGEPAPVCPSTSGTTAAAYAPAVPVDTAPASPFVPPVARRAALVDALGPIPLGAYDERILTWLCEWDDATVRTVVSLVGRAVAAVRADERADRRAVTADAVLVGRILGHVEARAALVDELHGARVDR